MSLLVVTGPPGAGKSTVSRILAGDASPSAVVTGDSFFAFLHRGGIDPRLPGAQEQNEAVTEAAAAAAGRLARRLHVVLDGMVGPWFLPAFLAAAGVDELDYVVLLPDEATCVLRVAQRTAHGFTDAGATRHMHREFVAAQVEERHVITDPPHDPVQVARLVRHRRSAGGLSVRA